MPSKMLLGFKSLVDQRWKASKFSEALILASQSQWHKLQLPLTILNKKYQPEFTLWMRMRVYLHRLTHGQ